VGKALINNSTIPEQECGSFWCVRLVKCELYHTLFVVSSDFPARVSLKSIRFEDEQIRCWTKKFRSEELNERFGKNEQKKEKKKKIDLHVTCQL